MAEHKAAIVGVVALGDGHLAVKARCCGDRSSDSVRTILELQRPDEAIDADVESHRQNVEKLHAARDHAQRHIERLIQR